MDGNRGHCRKTTLFVSEGVVEALGLIDEDLGGYWYFRSSWIFCFKSVMWALRSVAMAMVLPEGQETKIWMLLLGGEEDAVESSGLRRLESWGRHGGIGR